MDHPLNKHIVHFFKVFGLALTIMMGSIAGLKSVTGNFTAPPSLAAPTENSLKSIPILPASATANPVANVFINAIPGNDGQEIFVSVSGVEGSANILRLNVDPGTGGGNHRGGYALTLSGTSFIATAIGFTPGQDVGSDGDDTMSITTTVGSQVVGSGEVNFQRAFVQTSQPETISVDNGSFVLEFLNTGSFQADTYVLVMSTNAPPGSLPFSYRLVSSSYNLRPSGALTKSAKLMTLNFKYTEPLLNGSSPHSLTIIRWDALNQTWVDVGGSLLSTSKLVTLATQDFGIYALATGPAWRDGFNDSSLSGVSAQNNTQRGPGQTIILNNATTGTVTSIPVTAATNSLWGTLTFSSTTPTNTNLTVDILDANDNVLLTNVSPGTNLDSAGINRTTHPSLKLRGNLSAASLGQTPQLHEWSVTWIIEVRKVYLPIVVK